LVFFFFSAFTLHLEDLDKYETTTYVGISKPVTCLLPSKEKGSLKASEFCAFVPFLKNVLHLFMTQVIPAVLLIHYNFNYFNDVFTSGIV
jgi:hypothetical protein